jgi:hypothetical protein
MSMLDHVKPGDLAKDLGWSEKRLRRLAKRLGACCVLGNRMILLPRHVDLITKAVEPCPSHCIDVKRVESGTIGGPLPEISYEDRLRQRTVKQQRELSPRSKTEPTNVISMGLKKS